MIDEQASLRRKILSDRCNRIIFGRDRGGEIYLVGGYIRDILSKRHCLDRDYVIAGPFEEILYGIASDLGAKAVSIGEKGLFRIIVRKRITFDFSPIRKEIHHDLSKRDFTINAIAWSPATGIIDDNCGMRDLARRSLRMISAVNLREDPVRIIRAYRLAASLSMRINLETRSALEAFSSMVRLAKHERITLEFFKILNLPEPERALKQMLEDRVLDMIIGHNNKMLNSYIKVFSRLRTNVHELRLKYRRLLASEFSQGLSYLGFLRLSILMHGNPKHVLSLSSKIRRYQELNEKGYAFYSERKPVLTKEAFFDLFCLTAEATPCFLITNNLSAYLPDYERYLRVLGRRILSVDQIRCITGLPYSKELGGIIVALKKANFTGQVRNAAAAARFIKTSLPGQEVD